MKSKKLLSVLLAALMVFSLGSFAFAEGAGSEDGYNWVPIPTSDEGLNTGDYYLDFDAYHDSVLTLSEQIGEELEAEAIVYLEFERDLFKTGDWTWDKDAFVFNCHFNVSEVSIPEDIPEEDVDLFELDPDMEDLRITSEDYVGKNYIEEFIFRALKQKGANWQEVRICADTKGLTDGEYYCLTEDFLSAFCGYYYVTSRLYDFHKTYEWADSGYYDAFIAETDFTQEDIGSDAFNEAFAKWKADREAAAEEEHMIAMTDHIITQLADGNIRLYKNTADSDLLSYRVWFNITERDEIMDEEGNPVPDGNGDPTYTEYTYEQYMYIPLYHRAVADPPEEAEIFYEALDTAVKPYIEEPTTEEPTTTDTADGDQTQNVSGITAFIKKIAAFFNRIIEYIRNLFKK